MLALYFCIPLASLALTSGAKTYIKVGAVIWTLLLLAISRFHIYPFIGWAVFVWWMLLSILSHNKLLHERKKITTWWLAIAHTAMFSMVCAIAWSLSILWTWKIDVTCEEVQWFANKHIVSILNYAHISPEQLTNIQSRIDKFFNNTPEEVIGEQIEKQVSNQMWTLPIWDMSSTDIISLLKSNPSSIQQMWWMSALEIAELLKNNTQWWKLSPEATQQLNNMMKWNTNQLVIKTPDSSTLASNNPIAKKLQERAKKNQIITSTLWDRQELDDKICNVVFDQIKAWSTFPGFTRSILLTLILFFYPLIRLSAFICSWVISIIYVILKNIGFISVIPEEKIVETRIVWDWYTGNTLLSTIALQPKKMSPAQIAAQNATPPTTPVQPPKINSTSNDINDVLWSFESQWWGEWWWNQHIVTANSPQDIDTIDLPHPPKKNDSPHIDFGSFGWNFDTKVKKRSDIDNM